MRVKRRNVNLWLLLIAVLVAGCLAGFSFGKANVVGGGNRARQATTEAADRGPSEKRQGALAGGTLPQNLRPEGAGEVTPPGARPAGPGDLLLVVDKSAHTLTLFRNGMPVRSYHVAIGDGGPGDKEVAGDHRTPEGTFYVCEKLVIDPPDKYLGSRWMRLSYPSVEDAARGLQQGLIDQVTYAAIVTACSSRQIPPQETALGGGVGIHGGSRPEWGDYWTWGCIGLTNADVEDLYDRVAIGTPVVIRP